MTGENNMLSTQEKRDLLLLLKAYRNENVFVDTQIVDCCQVIIGELEGK